MTRRSPRFVPTLQAMNATEQRLRVASWLLAGVCGVAGFLIGFNVNASVGGYLLLASVALAFIPFATHRRPR